MLPSDTERLIFREATGADAAFMLKLLNEPSWRRFIRDHDVVSEAAALDYLCNNIIACYGDGYGFWIVQPTGSAKPAGVCGLIKRDYLQHVDIGFGFLEEHWGKGYAEEAAQAVMRYAIDDLHLPILCAVTRPDNSQSIKLLHRLGFAFTHEMTDPIDQVVAVYEFKPDDTQDAT